MDETKRYENLTPRMAWLLAAPHSWSASIFPVLLAASIACAEGYAVSGTVVLALLASSILLQSAVNALNDYFDFVKGTDTADDDVEVDDSVLVYNDINPASVRNLAIGFIVLALATGSYCIWYAGWIPLVIAAVGIVVVFLYSGGKTPISYLPIGEVTSGFVMGGLITFASHVVLSRSVEWIVLVWSVPMMIGVGLTMLTNNTCDVEKDKVAKRRTLPVLIGRERARRMYHIAIVAWYVTIIGIVSIWFTNGVIMAPFMLLASYPIMKALLANPLLPSSRIAAMSQVCNANIALGAFYCASIVASGATIVL